MLVPRVLRLLLWSGVVAGLGACVSTRVLEPSERTGLAGREYEGDGDDVYAATWLLLERQGFRVVDSDRQAGTFAARHADGRGYDVDISAHGGVQRVRAVPTGVVTHAAQLDAWDALEADTRRLLRAWERVPEWTYDARRSVLAVAGFSFAVPREWARLDFSVNRRRVTAQAHNPKQTGFNPTLLAELERRRPRTEVLRLGQVALGLALTASSRLVYPDEVQAREDGDGAHAALRVLDGNLTHEATLHLWGAADATWTYRLALACPSGDDGAACDETWREVMRSLVTTEARRQPFD